MSNYTEQVKKIILQFAEEEIFNAKDVYDKKLNSIPEVTYYKILERLVKQQELVHLTKGLYYRAQGQRGKIKPLQAEYIIDYYTKNDRGTIIGQKVLFDYGIALNQPRKIEILSNGLKEEKKHIGDVEVQKTKLILDNNTVPVIKTLEILQNYKMGEYYNKNRFLSYMRNFSENYYDDVTRYVLDNRKYKKSTIAFLERILEWYGVENSLNEFLSPLSKYKIPAIDELKVSLTTDIKNKLQNYIDSILNIYKDEVLKIILFGSYARGDYDEDSDIDIMILLRLSDNDIKNYRHQLSDCTYDFNETYGLDVKPIAKNYDEFMKWNESYPFYENIRRDGVELYGAA